MTPEAGFEKRVLDSDAKQKKIIKFIAGFREEYDFPPTVREIMNGTDLSSTSVVNYHLEQLAEKGLLTRKPNSARTIVLTAQGEDFISQENTGEPQNY